MATQSAHTKSKIMNFPQTLLLENLFLQEEAGGENGESGNYVRAEKVTKITLLGYWSHVLVNPKQFFNLTNKVFFKIIVCKNNWMDDKILSYSIFNHSPTICQSKIFIFNFFPILKSFISSPY